MHILIELPDLLQRVKMISYIDFSLEQHATHTLIQIHTFDEVIGYQLSAPLSEKKAVEITGILNHYKRVTS